MASGQGNRSGGKSTGRKSSSGRSQSRASSGKGKSAQAGRAVRQSEPMDLAIRNEVILIGVLALAVFLFLCNFGIVGVVGDLFSDVMFGILGLISYAAPVLFFLAVAFGISNRGNSIAVRKLVAAVILFLLIEMACDLFTGEWNADSVYHVKDLYERCSRNHNGGGVIGGTLAYVSYHFLSMVGTALLMVVLAVICMVIITEKSVMRGVKSGGKRMYEKTREDAFNRRERAQRRREEQEQIRREREEERRIKKEAEENEKILRMDKKVSGVMRDTTLPSKKEKKAVSQVRDDIHEIVINGLEGADIKGVEVTAPKASGDGLPPEFDNIRITSAYIQGQDGEDAHGGYGDRPDNGDIGLDGYRSWYASLGRDSGDAGSDVKESGEGRAAEAVWENGKQESAADVRGNEKQAGTGETVRKAGSYAGAAAAGMKAGSYAGGTDAVREAGSYGRAAEAVRRSGNQGGAAGKFRNGANRARTGRARLARNFMASDEIQEVTFDIEEEDVMEPVSGFNTGTGMGAEPGDEPESIGGSAFGDEEKITGGSVLGPMAEGAGGSGFREESESAGGFAFEEEAGSVRGAVLEEEAGSVRGSVFEEEPGIAGESVFDGASDEIGGYAFDDPAKTAEDPGETDFYFAEGIPERNGSGMLQDVEAMAFIESTETEERDTGKEEAQETERREEPIKAGTAGCGAAPAASAGAARVRPIARAAEETGMSSGNGTAMSGMTQMKMEAPVPKKYIFPSLNLLKKGKGTGTGDSAIQLKQTAVHLQKTLATFGVRVTITDISQGPTVTRYELQPDQGVKVSKIVGLADDIKLNLAATDIRIEAPIPGKAAVGIEVPNKENAVVALRELLESQEFQEFPSNLAFAVGKDIGGKTVVADIARMPHMLIAGSTGSGKSVCINTLIMSILYKAHPDDVKLIMVDPKVVELSVYNGIPHLMIPVVTDPKKAAAALHWGVAEMTDRYKKFADFNVRDLKGYNKAVESMKQRGENAPAKMPQIVIIVDELADLMMVSPGEVEESICRLAQLARVAGIHLIIATQRPSVDVITGLIKANMPSRAAFAVSSGVDSRTILDMNGAEKLLGKGDMLFYPQGYPKPARVQGAFVSDSEVSDVVDFLKNQAIGNVYSEDVEAQIKTMGSASAGAGAGGGESGYDQYFADAGRFIIEKDKASIGMLQRVFKIGFNRAARIMDQLCEAGVVGEEEGTKPRKVLMSPEEFEQFVEETV